MSVKLKSKSKTRPWSLTASILVWILVLTGSAGVYLHQTASLRDQPQSDPAQMTANLETSVPAMVNGIDRVVLGAGILATMVAAAFIWMVRRAERAGRRYQEAAVKQLAEARSAWEKIQTRLEQTRLESQLQQSEQHKLAEAQKQLEHEKNISELQERFNTLSKTHRELQDELSNRKQSEKKFTQQRQELERSKDVLELHVQARTQELQKLQRRHEGILNSAGEGICGLDLEGRITFANPAAARITGWSTEELIGKSGPEIFHSPPEVNGRAQSKDEHLIENIVVRKDGSESQVEYVQTRIQEKHDLAGSVVVFKDITERKRAEETLAQKAAELARSNAELEQFAFVASHDLQEPLRKIQAFGDRLKLRCETAKLEEGRDYLDRMQTAAARMQRLINDLLAFSRVIRSSQPFVAVDLNAVTKEALSDLELRIEQSKAKIEVGPLPTIEADQVQIRQLMQNLIGNALKFQPPAALPVIQINAKIIGRRQATGAAGETATIQRHSESAGGRGGADDVCELTIKDNGIGFEEKYLDKIFAVFQRLHGRGEFEGTGVGLAVCRRIVDRHGGNITARSKPNEGATFIVTLPVCHPTKEVPHE